MSAPPAPAPNRLTVGAYLQEWLEVQASQVQPSTWQEYRRAIRNYVEDAIGGLSLDALTVQDLNGLYARLHADGGSKRGRLSRKTVRYVHAVLHKAFEDAIVLGLLTANPAHRAILPKRDRAPAAGATLPFTVWTAEWLRTFLEHTRTDRFADVWLMAAMTGMRRGELLGLGWDDVDCDAGWNLVFTDDRGRHLAPDPVSQAFRRLVRTVPLPPLRLHDLRDLHATLMHLPCR